MKTFQPASRLADAVEVACCSKLSQLTCGCQLDVIHNHMVWQSGLQYQASFLFINCCTLSNHSTTIRCFCTSFIIHHPQWLLHGDLMISPCKCLIHLRPQIKASLDLKAHLLSAHLSWGEYRQHQGVVLDVLDLLLLVHKPMEVLTHLIQLPLALNSHQCRPPPINC